MNNSNQAQTLVEQNTVNTQGAVAQASQVESEFVNVLIKSKSNLNIFLLSGIKLTGAALESDDKCMILSNDRSMQLVYKQAVATISPDGSRFGANKGRGTSGQEEGIEIIDGNVEKSFIDVLISQKVNLSIYLLSGIKLTGTILKSDDKCFILVHGHNMQIIYKQSVATLLLEGNIQD